MDTEALEFRAACIQAARKFFITNGYLELDTPALASALIPETCLEVFRTDYRIPFKIGSESTVSLFLTPSPEVYIKPIIAQCRRSVFQLSKCYRNCESRGAIHNPEFTMLEYYTVDAGYKDSIRLTERFIRTIAEEVGTHVLADSAACRLLSQPFLQLTMDEAFVRYAGFSLAACTDAGQLAEQAERHGLGSRSRYSGWAWDDLYELLLVHCVEPALPRDVPVALLDYPARVPCLAAENTCRMTGTDGHSFEWITKERWELYVCGVELANCYTEERDAAVIEAYFKKEAALKESLAAVPHPPVENFGKTCAQMPPCSGVAMGFDRLIMLLAGKKTLSSLLHVSF